MRLPFGQRVYWKLLRAKQAPHPEKPNAIRLSDFQPLANADTGLPNYYRTREAAEADRDHLNRTAPKGVDRLILVRLTILEEIDEPINAEIEENLRQERPKEENRS
jgi:hypothetical protein